MVGGGGRAEQFGEDSFQAQIGAEAIRTMLRGMDLPTIQAELTADLTEDVVRGIALERGMVDVKVCAIDAVWSGLKLVYRLADRPKLERGWRG